MADPTLDPAAIARGRAEVVRSIQEAEAAAVELRKSYPTHGPPPYAERAKALTAFLADYDNAVLARSALPTWVAEHSEFVVDRQMQTCGLNFRVADRMLLAAHDADALFAELWKDALGKFREHANALRAAYAATPTREGA